MRGKGEGSIFEDKERGLWTAVIELPPDPMTGKRRRKTIRRKDKGDLLEERSRIMLDLDRIGDLPTSSPTLAVWIETWLTRIVAPHLKPKTATGYRSYMQQYVVPSIGRYRLDKLTADHVRRVHETILEQGLSSTTALQAHRILSKCLADAVREGKVPRNVATLVRPPRKAVTQQEVLTLEQAKVLLQHVASRPDGARWAVTLLTGMRIGEQLGITRDALDLDRGVITVAWALSRITYRHGCPPDALCGRPRGGNCPQRIEPIPAGMEGRQISGGLWLLRPKSRAGWREVPMPDALVEILRRHVAATEPDDLIFTRPGGGPIDPSKAWHEWVALLDECGLPRVKLHSARHMAATLLYAMGVPEQTRMAILGHSSATVTAGYTHLSDEQTRDAMQRFGTMLLPAPPA